MKFGFINVFFYHHSKVVKAERLINNENSVDTMERRYTERDIDKERALYEAYWQLARKDIDLLPECFRGSHAAALKEARKQGYEYLRGS